MTRRRRRPLSHLLAAIACMLSSCASDRAGDASAPALSTPDELPTVPDSTRSSTSLYLAGDGAALVRLLAVAEDVASDAAPAQACSQTADALNAGPSPLELAEIAENVPDPVLASLFGALVPDVQRYLASCLHGGLADEPPTAIDTLVDAVRARVDDAMS